LSAKKVEFSKIAAKELNHSRQKTIAKFVFILEFQIMFDQL